MPQSIHRKKGGGINEREPSAFIAYTYDSKTMPPCKMQSAKHKVLDEITGFARSRHPVKVYCYQWTTSNFIKERASGHLAIQQYTKAHSGCSPSLLHQHLCIWFNHRLKLLSGIFVRRLKDITLSDENIFV